MNCMNAHATSVFGHAPSNVHFWLPLFLSESQTPFVFIHKDIVLHIKLSYTTEIQNQLDLFYTSMCSTYTATLFRF